MQKDPSQGTLGSTCGLGQGQARKALVPCLIGKSFQRGHRSLAGMAASLVLGWNRTPFSFPPPGHLLVRMFFLSSKHRASQ